LVLTPLPEKQGLKQNSLGLKLKPIQVLTPLPEKQGLKQGSGKCNDRAFPCINATSRKTRIETESGGGASNTGSVVLTPLPEKQGLKPNANDIPSYIATAY